MKFEPVDFAVVAMAAVALASYTKLQSAAFLYVFAVLILAEIFVFVWERRKPKEYVG